MLKESQVDRRTDAAFAKYSRERIAHWDSVASNPPPFDQSSYYHDRIVELYRGIIPAGKRVLEIGSGSGDLLASLRPSRGVGVDFSPEMVARAVTRHPQLEFICADAHDLRVPEEFDYIVLSDLLNDVWDVQAVLECARAMCGAHTRLVVNSYNRLWQGPLALARRFRLANRVLPQNWLSVQDVRNLLSLAGFEVITHSPEVLVPLRAGALTTVMNRYLVKFWPIELLALTNFIVTRPSPSVRVSPRSPKSVSVVVPARNEAGNIDSIVARVPSMGLGTELLFVEGNSTDETYEAVLRAQETNPERIIALRQPGRGKGDAVRFGFTHATGDIFMILDADMTVAPEELPRFYRAIMDGTAELVNGVRLVYPMERQAMQAVNYLGNKAFGTLFSWLLRQPVKDTLCGTKVLTREAYEEIVQGRAFFGDFDPFGDFDLLFGAAKRNLKIVDMPVRYRERTYGATNIDRWRHGLLLLRMAGFASRRLKFT